MRGVGTRAYGEAIGEMAETAGVSRSSVSRRAAEAAGERLQDLDEQRLEDRDYLVVYLDGIQFAGHHVPEFRVEVPFCPGFGDLEGVRAVGGGLPDGHRGL